ncbi:tRNA-dihydrouridine(20/20a) synthase [Cucumispora dikerogammari]|nr:tRNA-dihydrouridine(20/20a) synthase [Cucumispora dikerogammari]
MELYLAPMVDYTTPNFRKFIRLYNKKVILFTEMLVCDFIIKNDNFLDRIGDFDSKTIIQLGGSDYKQFKVAIKRIIEISNFRRFNINCGCPSAKVQSGDFGAVLMLTPEKVIKIINEVYNEYGIIVDVKCRLGVDNFDSFDFFHNFIMQIKINTPCRTFYIHARKCLLKGLSPASNRTVPPIKHEFVYKLKEIFPDLEIILNGEVFSINALKNLNGLMLGRLVQKDIFIFRKIDKLNELIKELGENVLSEKSEELIKYNFMNTKAQNLKCNLIGANTQLIKYNSENTQCNFLKYFQNIYFNEFQIPEDFKYRKVFILKYLESFLFDTLFNQKISLPLFTAFKGNRFNKRYKQFLQERIYLKYPISKILCDIKILFSSFDDELID